MIVLGHRGAALPVGSVAAGPVADDTAEGPGASGAAALVPNDDAAAGPVADDLGYDGAGEACGRRRGPWPSARPVTVGGPGAASSAEALSGDDDEGGAARNGNASGPRTDPLGLACNKDSQTGQTLALQGWIAGTNPLENGGESLSHTAGLVQPASTHVYVEKFALASKRARDLHCFLHVIRA